MIGQALAWAAFVVLLAIGPLPVHVWKINRADGQPLRWWLRLCVY